MPLITETSLLLAMEMRHHAGAHVGVVLVDEQTKSAPKVDDYERFKRQAKVLRTAALLKIPIWIGEMGMNAPFDTASQLMKAAGLSRETAAQQGFLFKKPGTNLFDRTELAAKMRSKAISMAVVMGRESQCCVAHTVTGYLENFPAGVVLTSLGLVRGETSKAFDAPRCFVFESVGEELW